MGSSAVSSFPTDDRVMLSASISSYYISTDVYPPPRGTGITLLTDSSPKKPSILVERDWRHWQASEGYGAYIRNIHISIYDFYQLIFLSIRISCFLRRFLSYVLYVYQFYIKLSSMQLSRNHFSQNLIYSLLTQSLLPSKLTRTQVTITSVEGVLWLYTLGRAGVALHLPTKTVDMLLLYRCCKFVSQPFLSPLIIYVRYFDFPTFHSQYGSDTGRDD